MGRLEDEARALGLKPDNHTFRIWCWGCDKSGSDFLDEPVDIEVNLSLPEIVEARNAPSPIISADVSCNHLDCGRCKPVRGKPISEYGLCRYLHDIGHGY